MTSASRGLAALLVGVAFATSAATIAFAEIKNDGLGAKQTSVSSQQSSGTGGAQQVTKSSGN
jgi:hypothetical protein